MTQWKPMGDAEVEPQDIAGILSLLASNRGMSPDSMPEFYSASLSSLSGPSVLGPGVEKAASILASNRLGNFAIIGDYDADGILSSAIIEMTIRRLGGSCKTFIPSRWSQGYGLNKKTVGAFLDGLGGKIPDALFVLDCGSSSEDQVVRLKSAGIKNILVIDHHIIDGSNETKSADAHVNWRRFGSANGYCAAGEAFQVARRACEIVGVAWKWLLPFAAIATVGDVVPVSGDNRIIIRNGIDAEMVMGLASVGLQSIIMKRCRGMASQKSVAFYVVPRINAAGRMGDPKRAFDFVMEENQTEATRLMAIVELANDERKVLQDRIFRQGVGMLDKKEPPAFVFLHHPEWSIGVCGISCSEMVEKYGVPTMMFGTHEGKIRGSGRSVPGVDIKAVLDGCGGLEVFEGYGGHEMACGATIKGGMFAEAQRRFGESLSKLCAGKRYVHEQSFEFEIPPKLIVKELGDALMDTFYPYCPTSNPEPVFRLKGATVRSVLKDEFRAFVKMAVEVEKDGSMVDLPMSAFLKEGVDDALSTKEGDLVDLYFSFPQEKAFDDEYGDGKYQLELVDIKRAIQ